jgi:predicted amidohydrolase
MPDERIVIRHGHVLTMDPELGDIAHGDVLIQGSQIAAVGPGLAAPGAAEIDARGMIVAAPAWWTRTGTCGTHCCAACRTVAPGTSG